MTEEVSQRPRRQAPNVEPPQNSEEADGWLVTYLDVITLVLVFFVVLLTFADFTESEVDAEDPTPESPAEAVEPVPEPDPEPAPDAPDELAEALRLYDPVTGVEVVSRDDRITLNIGEQMLFESGEARLMEEGESVLADIAVTLEQFDHPVSVEGHTDNLPIATLAFPSNWELSAARAASVLRHLASEGVSRERMRAVGYADTQPVADNATEQGRARNRRVELVIHLDEGPERPH